MELLQRKMYEFWFICCLILWTTPFIFSHQSKVKLKDVEVLTLKEGLMTNGRRSSPVPQLTCLGGSGGCSFAPSVVQCYNRGFDGYDTQWECKAEMDGQYRFGKVEVTCEGYDYPDDPYILAGSCGLEYTIDNVRSDGSSKGQYPSDKWVNHEKSGGGFGTLLFICVVGIVVYAFYKTCIAPEHTDARSRTNNDFYGRPPPPPGWRTDHDPSGSGSGSGGGGNNEYYGDSCSGTRGNYQNQGTTGARGGGLGGAGGFWTGAATGGLLGYMFGGRNTNGGGQYGWNGTGTGTGTRGFGSSGSSSSASSSRSTSGFGGTRRR